MKTLALLAILVTLTSVQSKPDISLYPCQREKPRILILAKHIAGVGGMETILGDFIRNAGLEGMRGILGVEKGYWESGNMR